MQWSSLAVLPVALLSFASSAELRGQDPHEEGEQRQRPARMERLQHMRELMDPMRQVGAFAPPHLLERGEALRLTDEQRSSLESLAQELKEVHGGSKAEAKSHREQLLAAWNTDQPNPRDVERHAQGMMDAQQGAHLAMLRAAVQARALLTPEQRGRVLGWLDAQQMMMRERMERMRRQERPHPPEERHRRRPR